MDDYVGFRCARSADGPLPTAEAPPLESTSDRLQAAQTPVSRNADWEPVVQDFDGVEMVLVPAGCFEMGSEDGRDNERPVHRVCFEEPFWIDRTEVTNGQFAAFNGQASESSTFSGDDRPRKNITWTEAQVFCESRGARLPTEAEWEYAARGPDALVYPWGNTFDCHRGNFDDETIVDDDVIESGADCDGYYDTAPVGSYPMGAAWVGTLDMSGNVWEWVADWYASGYDATLAGDAVNSAGPDAGTSRVLRGGSWSTSPTDLLRAAYRSGWYPQTELGNIGFRCVRSY